MIVFYKLSDSRKFKILKEDIVKNLKKYLNGFTLVEILIVVVIVGILAAIAIPTYYNYVKKGYATEAKTQIKSTNLLGRPIIQI